MRLSWNEIRARGATFAREWEGDGYERGQTQLFYQGFFNIFGVSVRRVAAFEDPVKRLGDQRGYVDLFWKGVLLVEQKSKGRDLVKAKTQALEYFPGLSEAELPQYLLVSDFQTFELYDLDEGEEVRFPLSELPRHVEHFGFIMGVQKREFRDQDPVNIHASELVGRLHDALVDVDQFYGIELGEFPARIAETAMWMMDHVMNNRLSLEFGEVFLRIPLEKSPHILHADALETDWEELLPPEECSFVIGNPPFIGSKFQTNAQRAQVRRIAGLGDTGGTLDYVAAWFIRAGEYIQEGKASIGFVATNSITQGEQVAQLWPVLFHRSGLEIAFAHRTFAWGSDARGVAHVHVVVIGLCLRPAVPSKVRLFSYDTVGGDPTESSHQALTPYLTDTHGLKDPHIVVREEYRPINGMPRLLTGSKPIDDGHYIFTDEERDAFLAIEPGAEPWIRPFLGAREFIRGTRRWIIHPAGIPPQVLSSLPAVRARMRAVREYRQRSKSAPTRELAQTPGSFHVTVLPTASFLVLPEVSSERREYAPIGWLTPPTVPSNLLRVLLDAELWHFGLLTSAMHMAWLREIGGRLKSDYRYSVGLVYNTFPLPPGTRKKLRGIEPQAKAILDARAGHPEATLADLYDPDIMPRELRDAHRALDRAVDRLYRPRKRFVGDRERVEHLFQLYEKLTAPLAGGTGGQKRKGRRSPPA